MVSFTRRLRQVLALALNEWRLLSRNPHGLAVLFLMPALFVLVMSLTLRNTLVTHVDLPATGWVVEDPSPTAARWVREWLTRHSGQQLASTQALLAALKNRQVDAGVIVRAGWMGPDGVPRAGFLEIWLGHRTQPAAAARLRAELGFSVLQAGVRKAAGERGPFASMLATGLAQSDLLSPRTSPSIRYLYEIESGRTMTAVQRSVPAWLVFGMFFVVIPMAGVFIQERNDGTLTRLASFGVAPGSVLGAKLLAFMLLNGVQLAFMLLVGRWLVPHFGGDPLHLGLAPGWFFLMAGATSAAAVSLALAIATATRSFDHAAALGGGINVILGAIAGVMVPRMLMPPTLQTISEWSPMGWALDGMQAVFLGRPDAAYILPRVGLLLGFSVVCLAAAWRPIRRLNARRGFGRDQNPRGAM